jgi:methionyl-tRNA synthetase
VGGLFFICCPNFVVTFIKKEILMTEPARISKGSTWTITTSIPYVNAYPHLGHALENVQADVLARYHRLLGYDVRFQSGTDENSLKNVQAAEQEGIETAALVERNAARFRQLETLLGLSYDDFVRTSLEERHMEGVRRFWQVCVDSGDIYKRPYSGLYCIGCEQFYEEEELVDSRCATHGTRPEFVEEENYFFRLSCYEGPLRQLLESDRLRIVPETRRNEVLGFISRGLRDFSISRSHKRAHGWGIPVPGDPSQVIYVWFDALLNYITGPGYACNTLEFQCYWQHSTARVHAIGKDITGFHAIYWPAMLLSAGLPLPTTIFVHGFITVEGIKIGKSAGNAVDPSTLVTQVGTDPVRYYLLRKIPATADGNFSVGELLQAYNADLADQLGNLVNRTVTMVDRYCHGRVPVPGPFVAVDRRLIDLAVAIPGQVHEAMRSFAFYGALTAIWTLVAAANKYVVDVEPWQLARQGIYDSPAAERLATVLYILVETLRLVSQLLRPFLPDTAERLARQIGVDLLHNEDWTESLQWGGATPGTRVELTGVLFPKQVETA